MPELPVRKISVTRELIKPKTWDFRARELVGEDFLGSGAEKIVIADPRRPGRAIALQQEGRKLTPEKARELFYVHNILNVIFPHNFPHFYMARGSNDPEADPFHTGTVRQRIIEKTTYPIIRRFQIRYPFRRVERIHRRLGIPLYADTNSVNLMVGRDGGEYYVDTVIPPRAEDLTRFLPYMERKRYSATNIQRVGRYLDRLQVLQKTNPVVARR